MQAISTRLTRALVGPSLSVLRGRTENRTTPLGSPRSTSVGDGFDRPRPARHFLGGSTGAPLHPRTNDLGRATRLRTRVAPPGAEDLSATLSTLLMGEPSRWDVVQLSYVAEVAAAGATRGFRVAVEVDRFANEASMREEILARAPSDANREAVSENLEVVRRDREGYVWAEDNKWIATDGSLVLVPQIGDDAFSLAQGFVNADLGLRAGDPGYATEGIHTAGLTRNDPFGAVEEREFQGAVSGYGVGAHGPAEPGTRITRTYNEGGNMLVGRAVDGEPYAIVGRDGLLISLFHLDRQPREEVPEFAPEKVSERALTLSASDTELEHTAARLVHAGVLPRDADARTRGERALQFLTKLDITKDILAGDLGIPRDRIAVVPQPGFHIDMHMRPLRPGQVLIDDPDANIRLIDRALELNAARPDRLSIGWERAELFSMRENAERPKPAMMPVLDEIQRQLEGIGLEAVRAPGVFEGTMANGEKRLANFMNAVPATGSDGRFFYMTNYTSLSGLRHAYEEYLGGFGVQEVVWIGKDGGGSATNLSASERSLLSMGGLDCRENHSGTSLTRLRMARA